MAWIYLAESEDLQSPSANGSSLSLIVKSTPIVKQCYSGTYFLEIFQKLPYGIMWKLYHQKNSHFPSISFMEDSLARISVLQDLEKGWQESEVDYFSRSYAWPKKSSPLSYSLKMCQQLRREEGYRSLAKLPKWGMIVDGVLYPLQVLEQSMKGRDGFCLPTPTSRAASDCPAERKRNSPSLESVLNQKNGTNGLKTNPRFLECIMGYPLGWTELEPWAMQWFLNKRKKRSKS